MRFAAFVFLSRFLSPVSVAISERVAGVEVNDRL